MHIQNDYMDEDFFFLLADLDAVFNDDDENVENNNNEHAGDVGVRVYEGVEDQVHQDVEDQIDEGDEDEIDEGDEDEIDQGAGDQVYQGEEEDEPLPGWSGEEDGQDSDERNCLRWWEELSDFDSTDSDNHSTDENTSPVKSASAETEVVEEDHLPGPSRRRSREDETDENERCEKDLQLCHDFADSNCDSDEDRTVRGLAHRSTGAADLAEKAGAFEETGEVVDQRVEKEVTQPGQWRKRSKKRLNKCSRKTARKRMNKRKKRIYRRSHTRFWWRNRFNDSSPDFDSTDCDENTSPVKHAIAETEVVERDRLPGRSRRRSREDEKDEDERCRTNLSLCPDFANDNCYKDTDRTRRDLPHRSTGAADLAEKAGAFEETGEAVDQRVEEEDTLPGPSKKRYRRSSRKSSRKRSRKKLKTMKKDTDKIRRISRKGLRWWGEFDTSIRNFDSPDWDDHNNDENTSSDESASATTEVGQEDPLPG